MPDHACLAVALRAAGFYCALYCLVDCMVLVISCHLLGYLLPIRLKDDEVLDEIEKAVLLEDAFDELVMKSAIVDDE